MSQQPYYYPHPGYYEQDHTLARPSNNPYWQQAAAGTQPPPGVNVTQGAAYAPGYAQGYPLYPSGYTAPQAYPYPHYYYASAASPPYAGNTHAIPNGTPYIPAQQQAYAAAPQQWRPMLNTSLYAPQMAQRVPNVLPEATHSPQLSSSSSDLSTGPSVQSHPLSPSFETLITSAENSPATSTIDLADKLDAVSMASNRSSVLFKRFNLKGLTKKLSPKSSNADNGKLLTPAEEIAKQHKDDDADALITGLQTMSLQPGSKGILKKTSVATALPAADSLDSANADNHSPAHSATSLHAHVGTRHTPSPSNPNKGIEKSKKVIRFSSQLSIHMTYPSSLYDRSCEPATCNCLTPELAQSIKDELNHYKMREMPVHPQSRQLTHFFV